MTMERVLRVGPTLSRDFSHPGNCLAEEVAWCRS